MPQSICYTYFMIRGSFQPEEITALLGLTPHNQRRKGERRGPAEECALWACGLCESHDWDTCGWDTSLQMLETVRPLLGKEPLLREIKARFDAEFTLEIVPKLWAGETTPALAPPPEIIRFCYETGTAIDIDLYINEQK